MERYRVENMDEVVAYCIYNGGPKASFTWMRDNGAVNGERYLREACVVSVRMMTLIQKLYPIATFDKDRALSSCLAKIDREGPEEGTEDYDGDRRLEDWGELVDHFVALGAELPGLEAFQDGISAHTVTVLMRIGCKLKIER
jgi:hypothetical protein